MSSFGQAVGGVIGAVVGFFTPLGPIYGAQLGMMAGGYLDPPKGPTIEGPRLDDLTVQTSTYGAVIPRLYGTIATTGNVFWLENNKLKEKVKKTKSGGKGGGSSTTTKTYSYYATFAVGLCRGPIAGVRRIWIGGKLIYDAGSADGWAVKASNQASVLFTVHKGTNDQDADDRMQATLGVENTPAYRGLAYIVFKDYPLADHGNSLLGAQVKAEVVKLGYDADQLTTIAMPSSGTWAAITVGDVDAGEGIVAVRSGATCEYSPTGSSWTSRAMPANIDWTSVAYGHGYYVAIARNSSTTANSNDGKLWYAGGLLPGANQWTLVHFNGKFFMTFAGSVWSKFTSGVGWSGYLPMPSNSQWRSAATKNGVTCVISQSGPLNGTPVAAILTADGTWTQAVVNNTNAIWTDITASGSYFVAVGTDKVYTNPGHIARSADGFNWEFFRLPGNGVPSGIAYGNGQFVVSQYDQMAQTGHIYASRDDGATWRLCGTPLGFATNKIVYAGAIFSVVGVSTDKAITVVLDIQKETAQSLASIVRSELLGSNLLSSADIDTSELTQTVRGYKISSVAALRAGIEPLQGAFPFDVIQSGYKIVFKLRGSLPSATIPASDLDARGVSDSPGVAMTTVREMDSVLPRRVSLSYLDWDREYDTGAQSAERLSTDAVNVRSVEMAIVLTADEAAKIAEVLLYLYWMERYSIAFSLPASYNQLEPGDVISVLAGEGAYNLRLTEITYTQDGRLECNAKFNSSATYVSMAQGVAGPVTNQALAPIGASVAALMDIPLLLDSTDQAGFVVALSGVGGSWPGGVIVRSDDGGETWTEIHGVASPGSVIGYASTTIGTGRTDIFDTTNEIDVLLTQGELSSVSELSVLNGSNWFAYGGHGRWEIIGAKNCALQSDGSYRLTDLLRGRKGTEWARGLHSVGDRLILLDSSAVDFVASSLDSIGKSRIYRGVTAGREIESASDVNFTYSGVNLECLSPVCLNGDRHPTTNDWTLTWIRRTRVGGEWRDYVDAALGEAAESYEVEIYSSNTYATLKRTLTGLSSTTATYTSANQVTDFGSNQSTLYVKVYQISAVVGRGYPMTTSITR